MMLLIEYADYDRGTDITTSCTTVLIVQELCESWGGRPGLSVLLLTSLVVSVDVMQYWIEPCIGIGLSLSEICQPTSEDIND